jgi:dTDP-4-amino-4,6-dideoxygalactose transaminase
MNAPNAGLKPEFLPFALPDIGEAEIAEVVACLRSGWITTGPKTAQFEKAFAEYIGGGVEAIAVNSATAGLHLAVEALGIGPGDEVIVPVHTFTATAEIVRYMGADPVFVDVEPGTLNMDPGKIEAALTPRTKAILPVHYAGLACNMAPIVDIARRHGLRVVEDAAHALPATFGGARIGTLDTDATVFSFYATKTLATGEGGMLVTRDPQIAKRARIMRLHGISRDVFDRYRAGGAWYYEVVAPGFKYNMTDIAAAMGVHQLARLGEMHLKRKKIAETYLAAFADFPLVLPSCAPVGEAHAWHLFPVRVTPAAGISRDELVARLGAKGIGISVHYVPLHMHPYWRDRYHLKPEDFPVSTAAYEAMVSLPIYSKMTGEDVERVVTAVCDALTPQRA